MTQIKEPIVQSKLVSTKINLHLAYKRETGKSADIDDKDYLLWLEEKAMESIFTPSIQMITTKIVTIHH